MNNALVPIEYNNQRVLTTEQLAEAYGTDVNNIKNNYGRNKKRFIEGKHYYFLECDKLRTFKNCVTESDLVNKHTKNLYLWTHRGASRHSKILDTDKAWEQFDILEESYFKKAEQINNFNHMKMFLYENKPCTRVKSIMSAYRCSDITVLEYLKRIPYGKDYDYLMGEDLRVFKEDNKLDNHISSIYIIYPTGLFKIERFLQKQGYELSNKKPELVLI